jgi:hypothetical protein
LATIDEADPRCPFSGPPQERQCGLTVVASEPLLFLVPFFSLLLFLPLKSKKLVHCLSSLLLQGHPIYFPLQFITTMASLTQAISWLLVSEARTGT